MSISLRRAGLCALGFTAALIPPGTEPVHAADHQEAPNTKANKAADITDVYAWHTGDGKIVAVLDFAGFGEAGLPATFDPQVLYGIHVDNDGDFVADHDVWVRFGQDTGGNWGVQVTDLPGGDPVVVGPVGTTIDAGLGLRVWAGLRDDPFFFDFEGFVTTAMTGTVSFDKDNDTFAMTNVTAIIVEMSADAVVGAGSKFRLWASTRVRA